MTTNDPGSILSDLRGHRWRSIALALTWMILFFFRGTGRDSSWEALIGGLQFLLLAILGGGALYFVETRRRGRARWWGRIATLAAVSGALLLSIVWGLDRFAWTMAGIFWFGLCTLATAWMLLSVEVPE